ncbi:MAG TPA: nucleotide exchange factor GrpE [Gemmatimonadaceae bacterium]|jgi:molecular chaperone GrpE|nr:nucleotide exchange factor GrpE [Gemmatimonadaceae bacterium]
MRPRNRNKTDAGDGSPESENTFARGDHGAGDEDDGERDDQLDDGQLDVDEQADGDPGAMPTTAQIALERQLAEHQDKYLRLAAEYDNFRKRTARERGEQTSRAQAELVRLLLDPLDDLSRFAHVDPATVDAATVVQGVDMVERKLLKTLGAAGLEIIDPINQTFDPKVHEAVATEPALSPEDDHVVARVFQAGYLFNGQLLRPARVVVKQWNG